MYLLGSVLAVRIVNNCHDERTQAKPAVWLKQRGHHRACANQITAVVIERSIHRTETGCTAGSVRDNSLARGQENVRREWAGVGYTFSAWLSFSLLLCDDTHAMRRNYQRSCSRRTAENRGTEFGKVLWVGIRAGDKKAPRACCIQEGRYNTHAWTGECSTRCTHLVD